MQIQEVDAHLAKALVLARSLLQGQVGVQDQGESYVAKVEDLVDHVLELHEHLRHGGALPALWTTSANGRVRG